MKIPAPNRIAVYLTALASVLTAVAPLVAELDTSSIISLIAGLAGIVTVVTKWLDGWQQAEARRAHPALDEPPLLVK